MKKTIAILLCILLMMQTMVFAQDDSTQITYELVSSNASTYSLNRSNTGNAVINKGTVLTDGVTDNTEASGSAGFGINTIPTMTWIDLGEEMRVDKVIIYCRDGRSVGQEYYLSNVQPSHTWTETDGVLLGTKEAFTETVSASEYILTSQQAGNYRYVIVKTETGVGGYLTEIEAYKDASYVAPDDGDDGDDNTEDDSIVYESVTGNAISCKANATATTQNYERDANNALVDGNPATSYGTGPVGDAYITFLDLGEGGKRVDKVVVTTSDGRTVGQVYYLADTIPVNGADRTNWVQLGTRTEVGTMTFVLTEEQAGTWRYIVADCTSSSVGGYVNEIEVYKDASYVEPDDGGTPPDGGGTIPDGGGTTPDGGGTTPDGGGTTPDGGGTTPDGGGTTPDDGNGDNTEDDSIVYESVTSNAVSCKASATATAENYERDANNALIDGNPATSYGTGPVGDAYITFLDLGEGGRRVDKVVVTANDNRTIGQKYYLADTVPVNGANRANWKLLGTRTQLGTMTFVLTAEQAGVWRYIVADCTGSTVGGYVNEIEAYMNPAVFEEEMKAAFAAVTAETALGLINQYPDTFDVSLRSEISKANDKSGTLGESFMLAKEALTSGMVHDSITEWTQAETWVAAVKAALIIDATMHGNEVSKLVAKYGEFMPKVFENTDYDSDEIDDILPSVVSVMQPKTLTDVVAVYQRAIGLSLIINGSATECEKALTSYADALGIQSTTMSGTTYTTAQIAEQLNTNLAVIKSRYVSGMDSSVRDIISWLGRVENTGTGTGATIMNGGGGAGGGFGGGTGQRVEASGGGVSSSVETFEPVEEDTKKEPVFHDLADHEWAQEHIETLVNRGIVSGKGNGVFDPEGSLTREETVKMLVLTSGLSTDRTDNAFLDCDKNGWYYPYVTAAAANGLVNGYSIVQFGLGQNVSRQDLAVMLYRVLIRKNMVKTDNMATFTDAEDVADYAEVAVEVLGGMGIITGFEDGSFGPTENTTRAQAAVIFGRFLELVDNMAEKEEM